MINMIILLCVVTYTYRIPVNNTYNMSTPEQLSIYLYERSTYRYNRLNELNVQHVHGPCFSAPFISTFFLKPNHIYEDANSNLGGFDHSTEN